MDTFNQKIEELTQIIKESDTYKNYIKAMEEIKAHPDKWEMANAFRKRNFDFQNGTSDNKEYMEETMMQQHSLMEKDEYCSKFLNAELDFCRLFQNLNFELIRLLDIDLGFKP